MSWKLAISLVITGSIPFIVGEIFHERISTGSLRAIQTPGKAQYWKDADSAKKSNNFPAANQNQTSSSRMQIFSAAKPSILFANPPLSFEANLGQAPAPVKFLAKGRGYVLSLLPDEAVLNLSSPTSPAQSPLPHETISLPTREDFRATESKMHFKLAGGNPNPTITGFQELSEKSFYYVGNDSWKWQSRIPNYLRVSYRDVYPGVDLIYYGKEGRLEYDFVVAPGADPKMILLEVQGARKMTLNERGNLILATSSGRLELHRPLIYQTIGKERQLVAGNYRRLERNRIGFEVGSYDSSKPLIIDPVLSYTTYVGRSLYDRANGIALGPDGTEFVTGVSPKPGSATGTSEAFVAHLSAGGSQLLYLVYLGGSDRVEARGIAVDAAGNAYITGETHAADFPTHNPLQARCSLDASGKCSGEAFVTKLNADGSMAFSTYLGGSGEDGANAIAVDATGDVYIAGVTASTDFPVFKPAQATAGGNGDAFVAKISSDGMHVLYATYVGGTGKDEARGIALDGAGNVFITGQTYSHDFPTQNALQKFCQLDALNKCNGEAFVSKLSADGSSLHYSTYLGGSGGDAGNAIAVDAKGSAYVAGATLSADFPTLNPIQAVANGRKDAFVAKLSPDGSALTYSTYLGGSGDDEAAAIAVATSGVIVVAGRTFSPDFPVRSSIQSACHKDSTGVCSQDAFVAVIDTGARLEFSSYLGGTGADEGRGIALDGNENVFLAGTTTSTDFPMAKSAIIPNPTVRSAADTAPATGLGTTGTIGGAFAAKLSGLPGLGKNSPSQKPQLNSSTSCSGSNSWTGTAGNNLWTSPTNWSSGSVPVSTDSVCIGTSFVGTTITVGSLATANQIIASLVSNADLSITGGPLAVTGTSNFVNNLFIRGGTLALNGTASVGGNTTISAGILGGTGTTTLSGLLTWTGGEMCSAVNAGGACLTGVTNATTNLNAGMTVTSGALVLTQRTLDNGSTVTFSGASANFETANGAVVNNQAGATWDLQDDSVISNIGGVVPAFNNAGTFKKSGGVGISTIGLPFNNLSTGTVLVSKADLRMSGGGNCGSTCTGTYTANTPGTLEFLSGIYAESGAINGTGTVTFDGGTIDFGAGVETTSTATVNFSAGILAGAAPGVLNFSTALNWTGGEMCSAINAGGACLTGVTNATTNINGGMKVTSGGLVLSQRTLDNGSTVTFSGASANFETANGAVVNNQAGSTWDLQDDSVISNIGGVVPAFNNAGTFQKTGGVGISTIGLPFNNLSTGTVLVSKADLRMSGGGNCGGTCTGTYTANTPGTLEFQSGTFAQSGAIKGTGTLTFDGATMDLGTGTETISTTTVNFIAGILAGAAPGVLNFSTALNWTGGEMCSAINAGGACLTGVTNATTNLNAGMNVTSGALLLSQRTLDNNSTATFSGSNANFEMANGAIVNNQAGATWDLQNDSIITNIGGAVPAFNNAGTFQKTGGVGISTIGLPFNNLSTGTVLVSKADLRMSGGGNCGGTCTGTYTANTPGTLEFQSGTFAQSGAIKGTGTLTFDGATMDLGTGTETISTTTVNFIAGILAGAAPGVLNFSTALNWTGGEMCSAINAGGACLTGVTNATTNLNAGMNVTSGALVLSQRTLVTGNSSASTFSGSNANFEMANGAVVNNLAGSTWDLQDDSVISNIGGVVSAFNNAGTFQKTGGVGISTIGLPFNNLSTGTVLVSKADLRMSGGGNCGGTCTGTYTANTPGTLEFQSGTFAQSGAIKGTGTLTLDGATMDLGTGTETISTTTVNFIAGILAGAAPGVLNFSTALNWTGGEMCSAINAGGACLTGVTNATTNVNGGMKVTSGGLVLSQRTLVTGNSSASTFSGSNANFEMANGAVVNNLAGSTWDLQDDSIITNIGGAVPAFNNAGTFKKSGGAATTTVSTPFTNSGSVLAGAAILSFSGTTSYTQTAGSTIINGGSISFSPQMLLQGGSLQGVDPPASTGITGGVSNTGGNLHPGLSPGKLSQKTAGGNYTQNGVAAAFNVTIAGTTVGTGYSQFSSDGPVTLSSANSILNVILANGFVPSGGDVYTIITTTGAVTGTFATTNLPALPGNLSWTVTYTPSTVLLGVIASPLTSITVTPANPSVQAGSNQQFTATATYANGFMQDITTSVTWASSNAAGATISNAPGTQGLAKAGTSGQVTTISATQGSIVGHTTLTVTAATLTSITVAPTSPSIAKGQTQQFTATGHFSDGTTQDLTATATWSSSLTTVATINAAGLATGVGTGATNITAKQNGVTSNTAVLTVTAATLTSITVAPTSPSIAKGQTQQFTATGHFSDGTTQDLTATATWSSSLTTVATINAAGLATGVGTGATNITAKQNGVTSNTAVLTVTAATLTSITVAPTSPSIAKGQTQQFTATGHFSDGTTQDLTATATWSSSLTTVATINAAGLATGVGTGATNITAKQNGVTSNTAVLTVTAATLTSITVAPTSPSIAKGQTQQFTATGHFSDGTTQDLTATATWSSSLTTVATINAAGLATGVGTGATNITATQNGVTSNTAVLTVTAATLTSITVAPTSPSIAKGQTQQFTATGHFSDGTTQDLTATATWSSSLTTVATINAAGLATGVGTGATNITATQNGVTSNTAVLTVTAATLTSITVAPTSPSIAKGQTQQFTATGHFSDGTTQDLTATATWSSSLTTVATINAAGLATGVGTGATNITATQNGVTSNTAVLTVTAATLTSITVAPTSPSIAKGQTQQFTATGHFSDGTTQDLTATATWSSSLTTVATINAAGLATGVGTGATNITAKQNGVTSNTAVLTVTAATLTSITVAPTSPSIAKGQTQQFTATGHFSDGTTQDLTATATWSSSLTTVATINAAGLATGVGTGATNITATQNGVTSNTAVLTVTAATLTSITVAPTSPSIAKGQTQQFTATGHFSDGTTQDLTASATWSSSLTTVATINAAGLATGVGTGATNITATQNGVTSNTAVLTVTAATLTSITVAPTSPSIAKGQTQQFTATGHFSDGTTQDLTATATWSSSLTTVATINAAGLATGVGTGATNITAKQNGVTSNTAVLTVTAATLTSITVAPTSPSIAKGQTQQFTATGHFSDGTTQDLTATATWSSSLTTVATINAAGLATGVGTGATNITAKQNGVTSNTAVLTVTAATLTSITVAPTSPSIAKGQTQQFTATGHFSDGTTQDLTATATWSSSLTTVATINAAGLATGVGTGATNITAKQNGVTSNTAVLTVTAATLTSITVAPTSPSIAKGQTQQFTATGHFSDGTTQDLTATATWSSSLTTVATINAAGLATGVGTGATNITAKQNGVTSNTAVLTVTAATLTSITVAPTSPSIAKGQTQQFTATGHFSDGTTQDLTATATWSSSLTTVATINAAGLATGVGTGATNITATQNGVTSNTAVLTVTNSVPCVNNLGGKGTPSGQAPAKIDLTWTGIPNVLSYNVLRGVTSGGPYLLIANAVVPAYSDTSGLTNGNTYYYILQPIDGRGSQVCQSNEAAITIPNQAR